MISEIYEDQEPEIGVGSMGSIDEVAEELSDLQLLDKGTKRLQASFWRMSGSWWRIWRGFTIPTRVLSDVFSVFAT